MLLSASTNSSKQEPRPVRIRVTRDHKHLLSQKLRAQDGPISAVSQIYSCLTGTHPPRPVHDLVAEILLMAHAQGI